VLAHDPPHRVLGITLPPSDANTFFIIASWLVQESEEEVVDLLWHCSSSSWSLVSCSGCLDEAALVYLQAFNSMLF
jgi:hypothetical protein